MMYFLLDKHTRHNGITFDFVLSNPPFNMQNWCSPELLHKNKWEYGVPPKSNANFAWLQHIISKMNDNGKASDNHYSAASLDDVRKEKYILSPGRYIKFNDDNYFRQKNSESISELISTLKVNIGSGFPFLDFGVVYNNIFLPDKLNNLIETIITNSKHIQ